MRKIVVLTFVSLDGVMQAPGGPGEDMTGGFQYGGWTVPHFDEALGKVMDEQMGQPFDLLLGRKTYDIFASYWPKQENDSTGEAFNRATKFVVSHEHLHLEWENSELVDGDVVARLKALKESDGPMLQVHGSSELIQTLLKHDLVDELWLKIFPITLGSGKRLFGDGVVPATWKLTDSNVSPSGVIVANYEIAGGITTGSFA